MNDTNTLVHGSGSASDPTTFEFHESAQSYGSHVMVCAVVVVVFLAAAAGFLLGFYFGKRRK
jgi:hypothetical protein